MIGLGNKDCFAFKIILISRATGVDGTLGEMSDCSFAELSKIGQYIHSRYCILQYVFLGTYAHVADETKQIDWHWCHNKWQKIRKVKVLPQIRRKLFRDRYAAVFNNPKRVYAAGIFYF